MNYSFQNEKFSAKLALFIFCLAFIVWLGGINIRAMIGYDLLQPGTLDFKANVHPFVERAVFGFIVQSSYPIDIAYIIAWFAGIIFLMRKTVKVKDHAWIMMAAIMFYLFTPVEIYAMVLDGKMMFLDYMGSNDLVEYRKLFIHRLALLAGVPVIALLCYYTLVGVLIFQPFKKKKVADELAVIDPSPKPESIEK